MPKFQSRSHPASQRAERRLQHARWENQVEERPLWLLLFQWTVIATGIIAIGCAVTVWA